MEVAGALRDRPHPEEPCEARRLSRPHPEEPCEARRLEGWMRGTDSRPILRDASLRDALRMRPSRRVAARRPQDEVPGIAPDSINSDRALGKWRVEQQRGRRGDPQAPALILRMISSKKSATFWDHGSSRMISSKKSATFWDHAIAQARWPGLRCAGGQPRRRTC